MRRRCTGSGGGLCLWAWPRHSISPSSSSCRSCWCAFSNPQRSGSTGCCGWRWERSWPSRRWTCLPRSDGAAKRLYINQTLVFLAFTGLVSAWAISAWNPWLPEKMRGLAEHDAIVPAFVLLWVIAALLDLLPTIEERVMWQAKVTVGLAASRALALSLAAILTRELGPVLWTLLAFVAFKVALLLAYVASHHGLRGPVVRRGVFADQLRYAAPLGAAGA